MSWRFHGRAAVNPDRPSAFACCDRCGIWYNLDDLVWQFEWRGPRLMNLRVLVCTLTCQDVPQEQLRPVILPPDPTPRTNPRPEFFTQDDAGETVTQSVTPPSFTPPILSE